ncbi:tyrosine-type recombinase/integrase [Saccharicrinis sp. 156]|uniref:tyrosine-type recombinase/integrase n=1 Tax=Saccharicrinis sp. 156 TaxID=3417574 RepID=UPI003D328DFE
MYYSIFGPYIAKFIALKNSLGYKYNDGGWALSLFDRLAYSKDVGKLEITKELAEEYSVLRPNEKEKTRYNRVVIVSQFARFLNDLGFRCCPPRCAPAKRTYIPYVFTREQIKEIFKVCDNLEICICNRNTAVSAMPAIIRLLYGTGVRVGEAVKLKHGDVDLSGNKLILRQTKNGTDRMVPFSESLAETLRGYLKHRDLIPAIKKADTFFIKPDGSPIAMNSVYKWFRRILYKANIPFRGRGLGPRPHDLRHTFCVHTLAQMSGKGLDLYCSLPVLSTYLGHRTLRGTDVYVRLTAEMYPDLVKKTSFICARVFPNIKTGNHETN